ncbi:MAG TPA: hypothetical protein VEJ46_03145 [Candidatus Acidoferrum sp.]|nr:hypothetical protein [Candidatus Acidoferrum sp.]
MKHDSVVQIAEAQLVSGLLASDAIVRERVVGICGIPSDAIDLQCVPLVDVPAPPDNNGDVDILLFTPKCPDRVTAVEAKRVVIPSTAIRNGVAYKLEELKKGVKQANKLARIGFHQVYLYIFVVVDSREQNAGTNSLAGAPREIDGQVESEISKRLHELEPRVGLYACHLIQPVDSEPFYEDSFLGRLHRPASPVQQPTALTDWVDRQCRRHVG